jgi:mRNA interferase MazF
MNSFPLRGEFWWCEPPEIGRRPVVVLSRDVAIPRLRRALIAPCTTTIRGLASEVVLEPGEDPVGRLGDARLAEICKALAIAVDCR